MQCAALEIFCSVVTRPVFEIVIEENNIIADLHAADGIKSITLETGVIDVLVKTCDNAQPHAVATCKEEFVLHMYEILSTEEV